MPWCVTILVIGQSKHSTSWVAFSLLGFFKFVIEKWTTRFSPWECAAPDYAIENGKDLVTSRKTWRWDQNNDHRVAGRARTAAQNVFGKEETVMEDQSENELQKKKLKITFTCQPFTNDATPTGVKFRMHHTLSRDLKKTYFPRNLKLITNTINVCFRLFGVQVERALTRSCWLTCRGHVAYVHRVVYHFCGEMVSVLKGNLQTLIE